MSCRLRFCSQMGSEDGIQVLLPSFFIAQFLKDLSRQTDGGSGSRRWLHMLVLWPFCPVGPHDYAVWCSRRPDAPTPHNMFTYLNFLEVISSP